MTTKYQHFAFSLLLILFTITQSIAAQVQNSGQAPGANDSEGVNLIISGNFYADNQKLPQVSLVIRENGKVLDEVLSDQYGKFEITLALDKIVTVHFEKDDFVDKIVKVDTRNVPEDKRSTNFYYKGWKVDMIPTELNVDVSVLKNPVAVVVFDPIDEGFATDPKYDKSVRPALKKLNDDVARAYDGKFIQSENAFEDYELAMRDGNLFLKEGDYENAIIQYEAAKNILPNETYPDKQIAKAQELMEANKSIDERYNSYIALADESFEKKDWEESKSNYVKAKEVKPKMEYPVTQLALIEKNIAAEKAQMEQMAMAERQKAYDDAVKLGDELLAKSSYQESINAYTEAQGLMPKNTYPQTKIDEINTILANQQKTELAYNKLLSEANNYFAAKKYDDAKGAYKQALGIKPNEELPQQKLEEIDALLSGLAALEARNAEMQRQKEAALQAEYDKLILSADALMVDRELEKAKADYEKALVIKAKEAYPLAQIKLIDKTLLEQQGLEKQYNQFMANGEKLKGSGNLEGALREYESALNLKPEEQAPKDAIASIKSQQNAAAAAELAKQKEIDDRYQAFVVKGDQLFEKGDYNGATGAYKQALTVKSSEQYPKSQIAAINDKLAQLSAEKAANEKEAQLLAEKEANYKNTIGKADQMFASGSYAAAREEYNKALGIFNDRDYPVNKIAEIDSKLAALAASEQEKARLEAEKAAKESQYTQLISTGDAAMEAKDYPKAKKSYMDAQKVFGDRPYPGIQLDKITHLEAEAAKNAEEQARLEQLALENKAKFDQFVQEGDALAESGDYEKAKYKYEAALKVIPGEAMTTRKLRDMEAKLEEARKLAEFQAQNDTEFNRQLAIDYPNGLNETTTSGGKTVTRIVLVANNRGDEYRKEEYSYGAVFYFKNGKKIDATTYQKETKQK